MHIFSVINMDIHFVFILYNFTYIFTKWHCGHNEGYNDLSRQKPRF